MSYIQEIKEYIKDGKLEDWVDEFLRNEGKNIPFADGLKKQKRYWIGPMQFPLKKLSRCCGPEEGMEFREEENLWNKRIDNLVEYIKADGELPPFIVEFKKGTFIISDGSHRFGAYEKLGFENYWTLFWCSSKEEFEKMKKAVNYEK